MKLSSLFQNGAILQRNTVITVSGTSTAADTLVCGILDGNATYSRTSSSGDFTLYFAAHEAGGPYTMEISCGDDKITLDDLYIGEVWLASGQSNMQYRLGDDLRPDQITDVEILAREQEKEFFETVDKKAIFRYFEVPHNAGSAAERNCPGAWKSVDNQCSAVAAWFALYLQKQLDVPLGLITSSWGGTIAEAWCSLEILNVNPITRPLMDIIRNSHLNCEVYSETANTRQSKYLQSILRPDGENEGFASGFHTVELDDSDWKTMVLPGSWIKQYIAGNGTVWIRKHIQIPENWIGKPLFLCTGGIDKQDISYFNGVEIGRTGSGASLTTYNLPRRYAISAELNNSAEAVIAVRGYSSCYDGGFKGYWGLENGETGEQISLLGQWKVMVELDLGKITVRQDTSTYGPGNPNTPGILFDSMIRPLIPYSIAGFLWYQGESNANSRTDAQNYYDILKYMINDWRYHFQNPQLPFIMVQLAAYGMPYPFNNNADWAYLRESQRKLCRDLPQTYMATAIDCGDEVDIHPQDKQTVGYRMAMCALNKVYNFTGIVPGGPELLQAAYEAPGIARLHFANALGLHVLEDAPQCFYVSSDGENYTAAAQTEIQGSSLLVYSADGSEIRSVKYAWAENPYSALYNGDGFPASPFAVEL